MSDIALTENGALTAPRNPNFATLSSWHLVLMFVASELAGMPFYIIGKWAKLTVAELAWLVTIPAVAVLLALYRHLASRHNWPQLGVLFIGVGRTPLILSFFAPILLKASVWGIGTVTEWIVGVSLTMPNDARLPLSPSQLPLAVLAIAMAAPISEELLFRGLLLQRLLRAMPRTAAMLLSATIFTALHNNFLDAGWVALFPILDRLAVGIICAGLTLRYRSLLPAVMFHAGGNLLAVLSSAFGLGD